MTTQQITAIALKLFSIWLLVQTILNLPSLIMFISSAESYREQSYPTFVYIGMISAFLLIGLISAFFIFRIANSVLISTKTEDRSSLSEDSQKFLLQLFGSYFIVISLAYLPKAIYSLSNSHKITLDDLLWPGGLIFQLVVGLFLVSKSTYWVRVFYRLRGRSE